MKRLLLITTFLAAPFLATAQEFLYGLNQFTPLVYNPGFAAADNAASIAFLNRRTTLGGGISYQNNVFQGEYPLIEQKTGKRFGGLGVKVLQRDAGQSDLLQALTLGFSGAYNLPVTHNQYLTFGLQANYNNKRTSLERLTTGSQWLANEFRSNPSADMGESIVQNRISYFGFDAGLLWYLEDEKTGDHKAFAGVTAFNLNKPNGSFMAEQGRISPGFQLAAGALVYHSNRVHITPQIVYQRDNHSNELSLLVSNKILFSNENPYDIIRSGSVELLGKFDVEKDFSLGIVLNQPDLSLGFSYNFPLATKSHERYFRNATEFGVHLSKALWKPTPARVVIESTSITQQRRTFNFGEESRETAQPVEARKSDMDIIQENIEELAKVSAVQFQLEKDFSFGFGKADLNAEAKLYLDDLYTLLQRNREYNIEVIGHTDNVGRQQVNYRLSLMRADIVAAYLKELGLPDTRIRTTGKGDTEPKAENDTEENRAKNRRVEFIIYVNR